MPWNNCPLWLQLCVNCVLERAFLPLCNIFWSASKIYNQFLSESSSHQQQWSPRSSVSLIFFISNPVCFIKMQYKCNAVLSKQTWGKLKDKYNWGMYGNKNEKHNKNDNVIMKKMSIIFILLCVITVTFVQSSITIPIVKKQKKTNDKLDN